MNETIRGVAIADLHLGIDNVGGLDESGAPRRLKDFLDNFEQAVHHALLTDAHLFIIAGDIFKHRNPPQRTLYLFLRQIGRLIEAGITVAVVRGNHEGDSDLYRANVLDTMALIETGELPEGGQVVTFNTPRREAVTLRGGAEVDLIGIPWPRVRNLLPDMGDMPYDEVCAAGDQALRRRIDDLSQYAHDGHPQILIAHLAVAGADTGSEKWMTLGWEPTIQPRDIPPHIAVGVFGHYHHGGLLLGCETAFYCGSIARIDFGEEAQDKLFWTFEIDPAGAATVEPHVLPDRPFTTLGFTDFDADMADVTDAVIAGIQARRPLEGAVVRLGVTFTTAEQAAAFDEEKVRAALYGVGVWWIAAIARDAPDASRRWEGIEDIESLEPADALQRYLAGKEPDEMRWRRTWTAGMEIIANRLGPVQ
jgi:DNA repair protein SbcD/Mre11